jgi:hypothetical protein
LSVAAGGFSIPGVATTSNPRLTIELEPGADPIRGVVEFADGRREPFWGWLELIDELHRVCAPQPQRRQEKKEVP